MFEHGYHWRAQRAKTAVRNLRCFFPRVAIIPSTLARSDKMRLKRTEVVAPMEKSAKVFMRMRMRISTNPGNATEFCSVGE